MQAATDIDLATTDLGPLAWVLDELRKSLDAANSALRRYVRDAGAARGTDLASVDTGQLRIARQQLHQAVGALEMVGMGAPGQLLRAMEAAVQRFIDHPELCDEAAAAKVERSGFALAEYLEGVLLGKPLSPVALFPQYRDVQELAAAERVHPADLWPLEWRWQEPALASATPLAYEPAVRQRLDQAALGVIKSADPAAAAELAQICLGLAAGQQARQPRAFWAICAAFYESLASGLLLADLYVKRAGSRVLGQYAQLAKGELGVSDRLALDLLFFCAQATPPAPGSAPALTAVRQAWALERFSAVDYQTPQFGRFDPALLAQARKRIGVAKETWAQLSGGDTSKLKGVLDQFSTVADTLARLHPASASLSQALVSAVESVTRSALAPKPELAMEVATSVLYLEASFQDWDPADEGLAQRATRLAARLDHVRQGGQPEPLELWMEELYRRVSDRQTMGSVVGELRGSLGELEKDMDTFFRNPQDKKPLGAAPGRLSQMRGVLSLLGLEQASQAVQYMRESIEQIIVTDVDEAQARASGTFDKLANSLGALGFLIDMLNYQPALAKKLFVFEDGELKPLMGRSAPAKATAAPAAAQPSMAPASSAGTPRQRSDGDATVILTAADIQAMLTTQKMVAVPRATQSPEAVIDFAVPLTAPVQTTAAVLVTPAPSASVEATPAQAPAPAPAAAPQLLDEDALEILQIFLDEAREVVQGGQAALEALGSEPSSLAELTTLRRAFHTLKGSSRMVGLNEFGEAAWSLEQVVNAWLAEQKPASGELRGLATQALQGFGRWVEDIAGGRDEAWKASVFKAPADAFRVDGRLLPFAFGTEVEATPVQVMVAVDALEIESPLDFQPAEIPEFVEPSTLVETPESAAVDFGSFNFDTTPVLDPAPVPLELPALPESEFPPAALELPPEQTLHEEQEASPLDEQVKVIGPLRIGIPLYNVFLNEADEWSRRLSHELSEWALELHRPVPESAVALAHSLAGSSATVGFRALSDVARALEHALHLAQAPVGGTPEHAQAYVAAAEEVRRLLHQFAAGFLKESDPSVTRALEVLTSVESDSIGHGEITSALPFMDAVASVPSAPAVTLAPSPTPTPAPAPATFATSPAASVTVVSTPAPVTPAYVARPVMPAPTRPLAPVLIADDAHDQIDIADALDVDLFPVFEEEAAELMPQLGGALRQWAARPDNRGARDEALRVLHTLKGSARLAGALRLGEMSHRMESAIEQIGTESVATEDLESLMQRFDALQASFDAIRAGGDTGLAESVAVAAPAVALSVEPPPVTVSPLAAPSEASPLAAAPLTAATRGVLALPAATTLVAHRAASNQAVRVRSQLLDRLVNQAGEVMITRSRLEAELRQLRSSLGDLTGNLDRLRAQLRDIELQAESQMQSRLAQAKDTAAGFDPLEFDRFTRVQELTRMMAESVNDVATVQRNLQRTVEATEDDLIAQARQTRELQRDLLRTRMVEFEGISERLYRVVRLASKEAGKLVKLDITGGSIEMDRGVLDRMTPAFEHLLRNCVAHGIEEPAARTAAGKDAAGAIAIHLAQEGNDVSVEFRDDGAGLNLARIREKALQQGLITPQQAFAEQDAAAMIFMPGFSTATQVTELSGRGIGMDVVRSEIDALGGRIETTSRAGLGTTFKLVLPLTTAVTQVVMIRSGQLAVGVPANLVEVVRRASVRELQSAYNGGSYEHAGEQLPFFWSGALLQASRRSAEPQGKTSPVVVFRSAAQRVALHVDEVLGNQEVVVKNLGPQLARLPGLAGMTVLASGAVVLIYNPVALATVYGQQAQAFSADHAQPDVMGQAPGGAAPLAAAPTIPLVLVVDDSITVRRVTQRLLQREGWRVALAADGLQALEKLADETPAVVLSDIEMPRMDGFDLARNIRANARWAKLPIVMITSRIAEKHREHAMTLGVNHYLGKPYSEEELLSLVRHYCGAAALV